MDACKQEEPPSPRSKRQKVNEDWDWDAHGIVGSCKQEETSWQRPKRERVHEADLEACKGMTLGGPRPKDEVNIFLGRYLQRAVIKGEDYWYTCHEVKQGIVSKLSVPAWNDQDFFGHACETQKLADNAAARAFVSDPEVQEVAPQLPPSMERSSATLGPNKESALVSCMAVERLAWPSNASSCAMRSTTSINIRILAERPSETGWLD